MKHFKQVCRNMVFDGNGQQIHFQLTPAGVGLIQLDETKDAATIAVLDASADQRKDGVVRISAEIYEAEKKKTSSRPSLRRLELSGQLRVSKPPELFRKNPAQSGVEFVENAANTSRPAIPTPAGEPTTMAALRARARRMSDMKISVEDFET